MTAYTVNQGRATPNLRLSCVQAIFQTFLLPMYLYMSASQSAATISNLNSLPLNLGLELVSFTTLACCMLICPNKNKMQSEVEALGLKVLDKLMFGSDDGAS